MSKENEKLETLRARWAYIDKMHQKGISAHSSTGDKVIYLNDLPDNPKFQEPLSIQVMTNG